MWSWRGWTGRKLGPKSLIAHDPFVPKVFAGSGAAWTYGFPSSIDGNAPSILQAKTQMSIFDRPQSYVVAQANEAARGADVDIGIKQDEAAYRVASLFLDAEQAARSLAAAKGKRQSRACEGVGGRSGQRGPRIGD